MICVMFRFDDGIVDSNGFPVIKVFALAESIKGVKHNGLRPKLAYIFQVRHGLEKEAYTATKEEMDNLHKTVSVALHPIEGSMVFQDKKLKQLFALKL